MDKPSNLAEIVREIRKGSYARAERIVMDLIAIPADAEKEIADLTAKLAEAEQSLEYERMRLAACSTAALGYFEDCVPEYRSAALEDVLALRATNNELRAEVARLKETGAAWVIRHDGLHDILKAIEKSYVAEKQAREAAEARLADAVELLAGVLSVNPDAPDCVDNGGRPYQSQHFRNWGQAQLAEFRAALAKSGEP